MHSKIRWDQFELEEMGAHFEREIPYGLVELDNAKTEQLTAFASALDDLVARLESGEAYFKERDAIPEVVETIQHLRQLALEAADRRPA